MQNDYAPQGTYNVGDVVEWASEIQLWARNGELATIVRVTPYGDKLDLFHVEFADGFVAPAMSNDFFVPADESVVAA